MHLPMLACTFITVYATESCLSSIFKFLPVYSTVLLYLYCTTSRLSDSKFELFTSWIKVASRTRQLLFSPRFPASPRIWIIHELDQSYLQAGPGCCFLFEVLCRLAQNLNYSRVGSKLHVGRWTGVLDRAAFRKSSYALCLYLQISRSSFVNEICIISYQQLLSNAIRETFSLCSVYVHIISNLNFGDSVSVFWLVAYGFWTIRE